MNVQVSIGLPTRNSIQFLSQRLESIRQQTFGGWELIVVDSDSTDGTREMLDELAAEDARVRVYQAPKDGIYPNFNRCIQLANGPFVYIATSDDTMAPDCLEKMVDALLQNPDCDLAHCPMRVLDRTGGSGPDWWAGNSLFAKSSGNLLEVKHKRVAPIDGILCLLGDTIYTSVTQLLIKRSLFEKIGYYQPDWDSLGDFHWNLRAGLFASTVHVPDTWGGWRMHPGQATANIRIGSVDHQAKIDEMIADVLGQLDRYIENDKQSQALELLLARAAKLRTDLRLQASHTAISDRRIFLMREAIMGRRHAWQHFATTPPEQKSGARAALEEVRSWFDCEKLIALS